MQLVYQASRYMLPALFLAYSCVAVVSLGKVWDKPLLTPDTSVMTGEATAELDSRFKVALPHRDLSIGLIGAARYLLMGEGRKGVITGSDGWLFTAEEGHGLPENPDHTVAAIAEVRTQLAAKGVKLVVVPVPAKIDVYRDKAGHPELSIAMETEYGRFMLALQAVGIPAVDTRPSLLQGRTIGDMFYPTDTHWTAAGARAVAQQITASGLLPMGNTDYAPVTGEATTFFGDLVSFVTNETLAPRVGLAAEQVDPYVATPANDALVDLFAADVAGIVLVGTSYSANPRWSFAEAIKMALRQDVLNVAEEGQGPLRPMQTYLASAELRDAPPEYVLWEIPVRYVSDTSVWGVQPAVDQSPQEVASAT